MADNPAPERRDFRYDRWQLAKFAAGSFAFVALGLYVIYWSASTAYGRPGVLSLLMALLGAGVGVVNVVFFGMLLSAVIRAFVHPTPVVTITAQSVHDRRWGGPPVPWSEVREISAIFVDSAGDLITAVPIAIVVDDPGRYYRPRGLYVRFTYGSMRNPLFLNMVALDGTAMDLINDLVARVPEKIRRENSEIV